MFQLLVNGVTEGVGIAAVTLGFAMVLHWRQAPNFAHGAAVAIGGYASYALARNGIGYLVGLPLAALAGGLFGLLTEFVAIRTGAWMAHGVLVATLGIAVVTRAVLAALFGESGVIYPPAAVPSGHIDLFGAVLPRVQANAFLLACGLIALAWIGLAATARGRRYALLGSNPVAAEICGMNRVGMSVEIVAIAGALAAVAGAIVAPVGLLTPGAGSEALVNAFVITILAQSRMDFPRILTASLVVGLSEAFISLKLNADFQQALVYAVVIAVVLFSQRPNYGRA
jgi:branched-chain amino acid transport system permease protein